MEFKVVDGHTDYCVDRAGIVYRFTPDGLRPVMQDNSNGSSRVRLNGKNCTVARLVAEAFCRRYRPEQDLVFHIDGDKQNNAADNLCWMTASEVQQWSQYIISYRISQLPHGVR